MKTKSISKVDELKSQLIKELLAQKANIDAQLQALGTIPVAAKARRKRPPMDAATKKVLAEKMKKIWAEKKAAKK